MDLTNIKGVGKSTANKLKKAGYESLEDLKDVSITTLTSIGISSHTAALIIESLQNKPLKNKSEIQYHVKDANKFRLQAYEKSEYYDPDNLEESYNSWWIHVLEVSK